MSRRRELFLVISMLLLSFIPFSVSLYLGRMERACIILPLSALVLSFSVISLAVKPFCLSFPMAHSRPFLFSWAKSSFLRGSFHIFSSQASSRAATAISLGDPFSLSRERRRGLPSGFFLNLERMKAEANLSSERYPSVFSLSIVESISSSEKPLSPSFALSSFSVCSRRDSNLIALS